MNKFNKIILEKFASKQAYTVVKGHYIPIVMGDVADESVMDIEKRKYYVQSYTFTLLGFLIDEDEFEVSPGINRVLQIVEVDDRTRNRKPKDSQDLNNDISVIFTTGNTTVNQTFNYTTDLTVLDTDNVSTYDVYINNNYFGQNPSKIQINTNDVLTLTVVKNNVNQESTVILKSVLV